jgi:Ni/Co efflux regulator RcnB
MARPQPGHRPGGIARPSRPNQFFHGGGYHAQVRGPAFRYPPGYAYRRWGIGARLPLLFLTAPYFYSGWAALGLQAPPPGYVWVRYGPDMLLVQRGTGQVVDVAYGVFY